jgi:hypothetical protein
MLETVSQDTQGQSLDVGHSIIPARAITEDTGEVGNLRDPTTVVLALNLDLKVHAFPI